MTTVSSSAYSERKFAALRKRLDQLGYMQTLGIESLPLVERLFSDLVQTIDSLRTIKKDTLQLQKNCSLFESSVEPYKLENGRLVTENNRIKHQVIIEKEKFESLFREQKIINRKLDQENSDLRFLNSQYLLKVKTLENESREKSEKILELQEKNLQAVIQTPGGKKQPIPFRRQRLEISSPPPSLAQPSTLPQVQHQSKDVYVADILRAADSSITKLREQLDTLNKDNDSLHEENDLYKNQVNVRDMEIKRLSKLLEHGRPIEAVVTKEMENNKDELILHLRMQLSQLESQNEKLIDEIRLMPQKAEKEKISTINTAKTSKFSSKDKRIEEELWDQLKNCKKSLSVGELENDKLKQLVKELKINISTSDNQTAKMESLVLEINKDKEALANKVKELTNNEKELLLEIDRLSRKQSHSSPDNSQSDTVDSLMAYITQLETQRDQYKEESRALLKLLQSSRGKESSETAPKVDDAMLKLLDEERNFYKKQYHELLEDSMSKERRRAPSGCVSTVDKSVSATEQEIDDGKEDRENYVKLMEIKIQQLQGNVHILSQEKEELLEQLKHSNEQIVNLQNEMAQMQLIEDTRGPRSTVEQDNAIDQLSKENDQLSDQIQILEAENASLQDKITLIESQLRKSNDVIVSQKSPSTANNLIAELTMERNKALTEVEQLKIQNSSLVQEYQRVQATLLNEKAQLQRKVHEMEEIRIPTDKDDSMQVVGEKPKGRLSSVETEVVGLTYKVKKNENEIAMLRHQVEEGERNVERLRHQIKEKDAQVKLAEANYKMQHSKIDQLQSVVDQQALEINSLQTLLKTFETERQQINSGQLMQEYEVAGLQRHLQQQEAEAQTMHATFSNMESYVENIQVELKDKELVATKLKQQLEEKNTQINKLEDEIDAAARENKRLLSDLTTVTVEHERVGQDLTTVTNDKILLQRQIQEYVTEVKRIQELLAIKEREREDIIEQYQHLSQQNSLLENQNKELEAQNSSVSHVLVTKDTELRQCQETINVLDSELQVHLEAQQNYQQQLTDLNSSVHELENELQHARDETSRLREELEATRDVCKSLDETNHHIAKQLYTGESDKDLLSKRLLELQEEMISLREHLTVSRTSVGHLESLMINHREKEFRQELTRQEVLAEVEHLRNRLKETEERMENQCREMVNYKTQVKKLEMDIERTKRQLTNEKFEKERVSQEIRRIRQQRTLESETIVPISSIITSSSTNMPPRLSVSKETSKTAVKTVFSTTPVANRLAAAFGEKRPSNGNSSNSSKSE